MAWRVTLTRSSIFHYLIDMNIYTRNLPVCNSGLFVLWVHETFSLFFRIWLTELIPIFSEFFFRGTCFLLDSNTLHRKFLFDEYRQPSLEWHCVNLQGEIIVEGCWWVSNMKISILLMKRWLSHATVSLKQEYHIDMARLSFYNFTILLI